MSLATGKAPTKMVVNQWLCIALLCAICFWVVLFYLVESAQAVAEQYISSQYGADR